MLNIWIFFIFFFTINIVFADEPTNRPPTESQSVEHRKQFRYVDDDEQDPPESQTQSQPQPQPKPQTPQYDIDDGSYDRQDKPLVTVSKNNDQFGRNVGVGVNVGRIYQMDLKRDKSFGSQALNLGLNVLNGLVRVNVQRDRNPLSGKRGPILVEVGGHTIYNSGYKK